MRCDPACLGCVAAGGCPSDTGTPPAAVMSAPRRWTPDRLAFQRLACGHLCELTPVVNDIFSIKEVWCVACNRWVKPPPKRKKTTTRNHPDQGEMIPF